MRQQKEDPTRENSNCLRDSCIAAMEPQQPCQTHKGADHVCNYVFLLLSMHTMVQSLELADLDQECG